MVSPMRTETRAELDEMLDEYRGMIARLDRTRADIAGMTATARSSDGSVTVTVGPRGDLVDLALDPTHARNLEPQALATRILETAGLAATRVDEQVRATVCDVFPDRLRNLVGPDGTVDLTRLLPRDPGEASRSNGVW